MTIGTLAIRIPLPGVVSLKDKRKIVKSIIERLKSRYNASVSEIAAQDSKMMAVIGIAVVSGDAAFVQQQLDSILNFLRQDGRIFLGKTDRDIFHCDVELAGF